MSNGDPDFVSLNRQVADLSVRLTTNEQRSIANTIERKQGQATIEHELAKINDTDNPRSLVSKVDEMRDMVQQVIGVAKVLRWLGAATVFSAIGVFIWIAAHSVHP